MRSNRSWLALVCSLGLGLAVLAGPPLGVAQGKTPPTGEEAKRSKAQMEERRPGTPDSASRELINRR